MMHISMIFDLDACICDAGFFSVGRTNKPILGVGYSSILMSIPYHHHTNNQDGQMHLA